MRRWGVALAVLACPLLTAARATDVVVVCPEVFSNAISPWVEYRESQGFQCSVLQPGDSAESTRLAIASKLTEQTEFLVLVGDAPVFGTPGDKRIHVSGFYRKTKVTKAWGSTPTFATDFPYGDRDGDGVLDLAVGRLPVDSPAELSAAIKKIIAYERSSDRGLWRNQVQLVGGVGGFGMLIDSTIESVTRTIVTGVLPTEVNTNVRFGSPGHRFYPTKKSFTDQVLADYELGARFWVYAGHGNVDQLDRVPQSNQGVPVLDDQSARNLRSSGTRFPVALMLACYTGAIDASVDSISERMWLQPGGPIAVIAGSRVTMPYGNTTLAVGLIDAIYDRKAATLGQAWRESLQSMIDVTDDDQSTTRMMIDGLAVIVSPAGTKIEDERREHAQLYNLLGDPLLQLDPPMDIELVLPTGVPSGQALIASLTSPIAGELILSIAKPLGSEVDGDPNDLAMDQIKTQIDASVAKQLQFDLDPSVEGPVIVRAHVAGTKHWATSAGKVIVRPAE